MKTYFDTNELTWPFECQQSSANILKFLKISHREATQF